VKQSARQRGRSEERAEEIAARVVNKQRREEGRTKSSTSRATGNPNSALESRPKTELMNRARELDISGRSKMNKDELIRAIRRQS